MLNTKISLSFRSQKNCSFESTQFRAVRDRPNVFVITVTVMHRFRLKSFSSYNRVSKYLLTRSQPPACLLSITDNVIKMYGTSSSGCVFFSRQFFFFAKFIIKNLIWKVFFCLIKCKHQTVLLLKNGERESARKSLGASDWSNLSPFTLSPFSPNYNSFQQKLWNEDRVPFGRKWRKNSVGFYSGKKLVFSPLCSTCFSLLINS